MVCYSIDNPEVAGVVVSPSCVLPLTEENVEKVLDEVRPALMADGGNVALHEIDGLVVVLKLQGACGSCPSSTMTLKMGIETRLRDKIPEIMAVEQIVDTETGLELTEDNVESVWKYLCIIFLAFPSLDQYYASSWPLALRSKS